MRDIRFFAKPQYKGSRALIIGIDDYEYASPLSYAVSDATAIRDVLTTDFGFSAGNVTTLNDQEATKANILKSFMRFAGNDVELDDRIFVFFAGHGNTRAGNRGETGFLVTYDSNPADLSTYIRWDDLTRNSELIRAKHMLFIMDACYGGLALTRGLHAGSARFLKDMMMRYSRQVLTAGKADEVVADSGGPLPNHSIFTGHLIEGMRGKAATAEGVITANGLMAYVHQCVATDQNSNQTPHYGYFDGDGDFVFTTSEMANEMRLEKKGIDELIVIPFIESESEQVTIEQKVSTVKTLLADESSSIKLHDFLIQEVRRFLSETSEDDFPFQPSPDQFKERITKYEASVLDLASVLACTAYWARSDHKQILQKVLSRSTDRLAEEKGNWIELRWYPILMLFYFAGVAAVAARRYDSLANVFYSKVLEIDYFQFERPLVQSVARRIPRLSEIFGWIKGDEELHLPLSEHLYKTIQPPLDDILFLSRDYESCFDEFEMLFTLVVADLKEGSATPSAFLGRFGWKNADEHNSPYVKLKKRAEAEDIDWGPIKNGLFGGSLDRFRRAAQMIDKRLSAVGWD